MTRPRSIAEVPAWAWSDLRWLPELRDERARLIATPAGEQPRSVRALLRRERLYALTLDILRRERRLADAGIDPVRGLDLPPPARPFTDTEH
mgnify:CR=1 FL=1